MCVVGAVVPPNSHTHFKPPTTPPRKQNMRTMQYSARPTWRQTYTGECCGLSGQKRWQEMALLQTGCLALQVNGSLSEDRLGEADTADPQHCPRHLRNQKVREARGWVRRNRKRDQQRSVGGKSISIFFIWHLKVYFPWSWRISFIVITKNIIKTHSWISPKAHWVEPSPDASAKP